ncbi:hypothetical protein [Actinomycetospora sp. CA-084318]|uniref:hypothetical protein n=1 Tax=Actinomycetospora sp. CA-084318 TaxID=3239892 RepID=UPI003D981083
MLDTPPSTVPDTSPASPDAERTPDDRSPLSEPGENSLMAPDETALTEPDSKVLREPDRVQLADSDAERSPAVVETSPSPDESADPDAALEVRSVTGEKDDDPVQEDAGKSPAPADSDPSPPTEEAEPGGEKDDRTRWEKVADTAQAFGKAALGTAVDIGVPGGDGYTVDRMVDAWDAGLGQYARSRVDEVGRALRTQFGHHDEKGT